MPNTLNQNSYYQLMTGPSHSHRLRHAIRTSQIDNFGFDIIGVGGMPLWSPRLTPHRQTTNRIIHMVGDFRFGNRILTTTLNPEDIANSSKEFLAIDKTLINPENDKLLYQAALRCIEKIISESNNEKFIFWDLTIREFEARRSGRYMTSNGYKHPTWNLKETIELFKNYTISTEDILENAAPFYIDSSAHPSFIGWYYIIGKIVNFSQTPLHLLQNYYDSLLKVFNFIKLRSKYKNVIICGNSKFTRILNDYIMRGVIVLPEWITLSVNFRELSDYPDSLHIFFPTKFGEETLHDELEKIRATYGYRQMSRIQKAPYLIIPYDHWASECVIQRPDIIQRLDKRPVNYTISELEQALCPSDQIYRISESTNYGGMIELGSSLHPSLLGVLQILIRSILSCDEKESSLYYNLVRSNMTQFIRSV